MPVQRHSLLIVASIKGTKGGPSCTSTGSGPHVTCCPTSSIWMSGGGTPYSSASLDSRSCPSQKHSSFFHLSSCCSIGSYCSLGSQKTLYPPWQKWSLDFHLASQSAWQWISDLFEEEICWKGEAWGECKATEGHGPLGCSDAPTTPPSPLPQPTPGCHSLGTCGRQAWPSRRLAQMGDKVRQLQGSRMGS